MTPQAALIELLARVGAGNGAAVFLSAEELSQWPATAVAAMKSQKWLAKARPATSVVCPGCERACVMPVHTLPRASGPATSFIVCDKRSDINRVRVAAAKLTQWRCDAEAVCSFIAASLGLRRSDQRRVDSSVLNIGVASGDERRQMLCLKVDGDLTVVVGKNAVPMADLINFRDGAYSLDRNMIRQLVDAAIAPDPRYTPSNARREVGKLETQAMYAAWQKAYRSLKKRRPQLSDMGYARQIGKLDIAEGRNADTIRKHMKP
jgi:hypothetical protein